jgi:hypothetical protein
MTTEKVMFNVEGFCNNGKYIPFWIHNHEFIILFHYGSIISPCKFNKTGYKNIPNLKQKFSEVVDRKFAYNITFTNDIAFLINPTWNLIKQPLPNDRKCCFYNVTNGVVVVVDITDDADKLIKMISCEYENVEMKIENLLNTTFLMMKLYQKYA